MQVASAIGAGLARATLAAEVDGKLVDACYRIDHDARIKIITNRDRAGIDIIRHSFAHLMGHAVKQLYPEAKMAIGPVIDNGFYYDIDYHQPLTEAESTAIEQRMRELIHRDYDIVREPVSREQAIEVFKQRNEPYKVEIAEHIPDGEPIALYHHEEYIDMCRGPHVPNTRHLRAFKLTKLAGAYWRGDAKQAMLQRVYGTAWANQKQLDEYLHQQTEAEKRDHRRLGKQMELFHFQPEAPGMAFWHERGLVLYRLVQDYIRRVATGSAYHEVNTPQMLDRSLWERSGHWSKFGEMIFVTESEKRDYAIKPMNCPAHVQIFNHGLKSYRDLPYRIAEFGIVHRNEPSGTLHGLMRARRFTQDDAHIFCREQQLQVEIDTLIKTTFRVYKDFGFDNIAVVLSTRPPMRVGDDALWDKAERALEYALQNNRLDYQHNAGEGAFYGPKIEFVLSDSLDRQWQCGTIQLDFSMPASLDAYYVDEHGERHPPVMIHRAILGSLERFIGILIEHYAGRFPLWLAPVQVAVLTITEQHSDYASTVSSLLQRRGLRLISDLRNEKIGYKIRQHTLQRVPYLLCIGDRELQQGTVAVRHQNGDDLGVMHPHDFYEHVKPELEVVDIDMGEISSAR